MGHRLLVLAWHNIEPTPFFHGSSPEAGRRAFERQIGWLRRWTNVVPLRSALVDLAAGRPLPPRAVALTFDDGYLDSVTVAAPLLRATGLPATFFLVTGFLSGDARAWWEEVGWAFGHTTAAEVRWGDRRFDTSNPRARRAASLAVADSLKTIDCSQREEAIDELHARLAPTGPTPRRQFMDWDEAKRLSEHGHDIGAHTSCHPILGLEAPSAQTRELVEPRHQLETYLQRSIDVLAYPNGQAPDYSADTLRLVSEAGYAFAVTTQRRLAGAATSPLEVPRLVVTAETDVREVLRKGTRVARRAFVSCCGSVGSRRRAVPVGTAAS